MDRGEDFDLDAGLFELRRKYNEMKKERQRSQKDANLLTNKLKMLSNEEQKVFKKEEKDKKTHDELDKIRNDIQTEKDHILQMKTDNEKDVLNKKTQINLFRDNIKNALTWRENVSEKNKSESTKMKIQKLENEQFILMNKKEIEIKNKTSCSQVKVQKLTSFEKKKKEEVIYNNLFFQFDKKLKLKEELETKIADEEKQTNLINEKINIIQLEEIKIIQRITCSRDNNDDEATSGDTNNYNSPPKSQKTSSTKSAGKLSSGKFINK